MQEKTSRKTFIYLHGLASSALSKKGVLLAARLSQAGHELQCPDLNVPSFEALTLSAQVEKVTELMEELSPDRPVVLIGSSMGGLVSLLVTNRYPHRVEKLLLISPAFQVVGRRLAEMAGTTLEQWRTDGYVVLNHYKDNQPHRLGIQLVEDASRFDFESLAAPVPTLIVHGSQDEVIPLKVVESWVEKQPGVALVVLEGGDHSLSFCYEQMWEASKIFLLG